ncbi:CoB--CoM heterodisulfide reductase iron-sulfur subunit B family protein [Desulfallas sp. Bu1-1]|uniref:CoB--CoM heterodisulfide reductase iron-sulfur subunit B family protein n=1 Tax=Desulfallas sp. Bu1-1 TaxID=2787620 RepID=UPI00189CDE0F|nr:CoB--CoM heterodisulfide reductase iron-sulfur subunit B family protein [Desulfallas sp. Bu1-1]MBF7083889.1 CoB--CoM heterodisulfide reductase iron-sulfur subunit B family protein [Desulfallas sp. Bu1-1]
MKYSFYPGCSMEATAQANLKSIEAVAGALDLHLEEIPDWNCCGATVASGVVGDFTQQVMTARNLAIAEPKGYDVVVGCSSCYLSLAVTNKRFKEDEHFKALANEALAAGGLKYDGSLRVRQFLEVVINDAGFDRVKEKVKRPLTGLKVAGYVGCQTVRAIPYEFDDPEYPVQMDKLMEALGATAVDFPMKARCCGSSNAIAATDIVVDSALKIFQSAAGGGAQVIVTPCPMCQLNLDAYQQRVNQLHGTNFNIPVLFFTQLMAVAFDLPEDARALNYCIVSPYEALAAYGVGK